MKDLKLAGFNLTEVDWRGAYLPKAQLQNADLRDCTWDDNSVVNGCTIDAHTQFGRFQRGDWIDGDRIRKKWIAGGAIMEGKRKPRRQRTRSK